MSFEIGKRDQKIGLAEGLALSPFGKVNLSWNQDTEAIHHLAFTDELIGKSFFPQASLEVSDTKAREIWDHLFSAGTHSFLAIGSTYQVRVWKELCKVSRGQTITYSALAQQLGEPQSARAVARAVATNPLSWIIPCHRVLPKAGGIGQYLWGQAVKEALLKYEQTASHT